MPPVTEKKTIKERAAGFGISASDVAASRRKEAAARAKPEDNGMNAAMRQVSMLTKAVEDLQSRVETLEAAAKAPEAKVDPKDAAKPVKATKAKTE